MTTFCSLDVMKKGKTLEIEYTKESIKRPKLKLRGRIKKCYGAFLLSNKKVLTAQQKLKRRQHKCIKHYGVIQDKLCCVIQEEKTKNTNEIKIEDHLIWIGDTGASAHMTTVWNGFYTRHPENSRAMFAQPDLSTPIKWSGEWKGMQQMYENGNKKVSIGDVINMSNVLFVSTVKHNLYSITKGITDGGKLTNEGDVITLKFTEYTIRFDYKIKTKTGHIMAAIINPLGIVDDVDKDRLVAVDINDLHKQTHPGENHMRATAHRLDKRVTVKLNPCPHCAKGKAKRKPIDKETKELSFLPGKRIDINATGCKNKSIGGNQYANVKQDYHIGHFDVFFLKKKSELVEDTLSYLTSLKEKFGYFPEVIWLDNSRKNVKVSKEAKK